MKSITLILIFFLTSILVVAKQNTFTIEVKNIQAGKGSVALNIYDNEASSFKTAYVSKTKTANNASLKFTFEIPIGTYAISIYQDIDNNGKLKQGWFDISLEHVGFGNSFRSSFSQPTFNECTVNVSDKNSDFNINLFSIF